MMIGFKKINLLQIIIIMFDPPLFWLHVQCAARVTGVKVDPPLSGSTLNVDPEKDVVNISIDPPKCSRGTLNMPLLHLGGQL
jgi:hypothetical protein